MDSSSKISVVITSRRIRWEYLVAHVEGREFHKKMLYMKLEEKRPRGILRRRWEDNIKINLETGCEGVDSIEMVRERVQWWDLMKTSVKLRVL